MTRSSGVLTLASEDGSTSGGAVTIDGSDGTTALGGSITILLGICTSTSLGSVAVLTSNAGTVVVLGDLLLNNRILSIGDSCSLGIWSGLSASGSGCSISISMGSGTNIGGVFSVKAGDLSGAAGGDVSGTIALL